MCEEETGVKSVCAQGGHAARSCSPQQWSARIAHACWTGWSMQGVTRTLCVWGGPTRLRKRTFYVDGQPWMNACFWVGPLQLRRRPAGGVPGWVGKAGSPRQSPVRRHVLVPRADADAMRHAAGLSSFCWRPPPCRPSQDPVPMTPPHLRHLRDAEAGGLRRLSCPRGSQGRHRAPPPGSWPVPAHTPLPARHRRP
jgi:hypothetical protein